MRKGKVFTRDTFTLGRVYPPGDFIKQELEARGWTQTRFAQILGRPIQFVNELVNAKRSITPRTAVELGAAFGTSARLWINLESSWQLSRVKEPDPAIARRAKRATVAA